jgi:hypothetical protein
MAEITSEQKKEILRDLPLLKHFSGDIKKLESFISGGDNLFQCHPAETHEYLLKKIISFKISEDVKSLMPRTITTWAQIKTILLNHYDELMNHQYLFTEMITLKVGNFNDVNEYLEKIEDLFKRHKRALQYTPDARNTDVSFLIEKICGEISPYITTYTITIALQNTDFLKAMTIIKRSLDKKAKPVKEEASNDKLKEIIQTEIKASIRGLVSEIKNELSIGSKTRNQTDQNENQPNQQRYNNQRNSNQQNRRFQYNNNFGFPQQTGYSMFPNNYFQPQGFNPTNSFPNNQFPQFQYGNFQQIPQNFSQNQQNQSTQRFQNPQNRNNNPFRQAILPSNNQASVQFGQAHAENQSFMNEENRGQVTPQ